MGSPPPHVVRIKKKKKMAALFHTRLSPFLSVIFTSFFSPQNLLIARKPVSVVACPAVAPSFARYVVMVITASDCFLFNVVWDLYLCFCHFCGGNISRPKQLWEGTVNLWEVKAFLSRNAADHACRQAVCHRLCRTNRLTAWLCENAS